MSWDGGFTGGLENMPVPEAGMSLFDYLVMLLVAGLVTYGRQALEIVGKNIPDEVTGWKGIVRDLCKLLAGYTTNKEHEKRPDYLGEPKDVPPP